MARKLKTFTTSAGFFDLAVAAPSMKAALEAWGSKSNLFHQGFAQISEDPAIVAATMAKPGVVLRRAVGSKGAFSENAELPNNLPIGKGPRGTVGKRSKATARTVSKPTDEKAARRAAEAYEREERRRRREAQREEAAAQREQERRERAIAAAEAALEEGRAAHDQAASQLKKQRAELDRRIDAEEARWAKERERLEQSLRNAKTPAHLRLVK